MGVILDLLAVLFGGNRNVLRDTAEVFLPNAEGQAQRDSAAQAAALAQFASEFSRPRRSRFDRVMDGINRLPRPALAFGTLGLFVTAMIDPAWFGARMAGIALVPEPMWWLLAAIVSFYFGARHQRKGQEFQRDMAQSLATSMPQVLGAIRAIEASRPPEAPPTPRAPNAALADWQAQQQGLATK